MGRTARTSWFGPCFSPPHYCDSRRGLNRSRLGTVVCVPLTSNLKWAEAPGNVYLSPRTTGLPKESVANVSQIVTLDKAFLTNRTGKLPPAKLKLVLEGIDVVLGR